MHAWALQTLDAGSANPGALDSGQRPVYCLRGHSLGPMRTGVLAQHRGPRTFMRIEPLPGIVPRDRRLVRLAAGWEDPPTSSPETAGCRPLAALCAPGSHPAGWLGPRLTNNSFTPSPYRRSSLPPQALRLAAVVRRDGAANTSVRFWRARTGLVPGTVRWPRAWPCRVGPCPPG